MQRRSRPECSTFASSMFCPDLGFLVAGSCPGTCFHLFIMPEAASDWPHFQFTQSAMQKSLWDLPQGSSFSAGARSGIQGKTASSTNIFQSDVGQHKLRRYKLPTPLLTSTPHCRQPGDRSSSAASLAPHHVQRHSSFHQLFQHCQQRQLRVNLTTLSLPVSSGSGEGSVIDASPKRD